jgi:predicted oxidoreductase
VLHPNISKSDVDTMIDTENETVVLSVGAAMTGLFAAARACDAGARVMGRQDDHAK